MKYFCVHLSGYREKIIIPLLLNLTHTFITGENSHTRDFSQKARNALNSCNHKSDIGEKQMQNLIV